MSHDQAVEVLERSYAGGLQLYSDPDQVRDYLADHSGWFCRCAHPIQTEPLGADGYILNLGNYRFFEQVVMPRFGLFLIAEPTGGYWIQTIREIETHSLGYEVDFHSEMTLVDAPTVAEIPKHLVNSDSRKSTWIVWNLKLVVTVYLPRVIQKLPRSLVRAVAFRLLDQTVRQISRRLSTKVQTDFHQTRQIPQSGLRPNCLPIEVS